MGRAHLRYCRGLGSPPVKRDGAERRVGIWGGVRSENKDKTVDFSPKYQRAEGVDLFCVTSLKAKRWELQKEDFGSPKDH